jgi:hypothetical protein
MPSARRAFAPTTLDNEIERIRVARMADVYRARDGLEPARKGQPARSDHKVSSWAADGTYAKPAYTSFSRPEGSSYGFGETAKIPGSEVVI